jgi:hypothetical protein
MAKSNSQKSIINREVNKVIQNSFSIDKSEDEEALKDKPYYWDDLNKFKEELGNSVLEFVGQVNCIITNPDIIKSVSHNKEHFEKLISTFFSDINEFSGKVRELRIQHENRTGHINDINEFNNYNRIAIAYHALYTELTALITPTLSDLILTISEADQSQFKQENKEGE